MGKIAQGILGGFSGTVGTVIGSSWRGISYMRSKPVRKKSHKLSQKQIDHHTKFRLAARFVRTLSGLVEMSFKDYAVKMTGRNSCMSYLLKNAIVGTSPVFAIDYSKVLISLGDLPGAVGAYVVSTASGKIAFSWINNSGIGKAKASDRVILAVHCPELNHSIYAVAGVRSTGGQVLDVASFSGKEVHAYLGFIAEDESEVASSVYVDALTIA